MNGDIFLDGLVSVEQDGKVILDDVHNKFTDIGMRGLLSIIAYGGIGEGNGSAYYFYLPASAWNIYLGNDTTTPTTAGMSQLTSPIGTAPGTAPNSKNLTTKNGTSDGIWNVIYTAIWNPGSVTGSVGELGLYLTWPTNTTYKWTNYNAGVSPACAMGSRLCVADEEFSTITIDASKSLSINWKLQFSFE